MRIVLHAGLHKSGTTSIQGGWKRAYADHGEVWYPPPARPARTPPAGAADAARVRRRPRARPGGRASVAFHQQTHRRQRLFDVVVEAGKRGVGTLLLSSEDLDRAREEDRAGLREALGDHDVTVVLTATRPVHRWCAGWQTLVRHGLAEYPADALRHVVDFAALRPGRLEELANLVPGADCVIRLVRHSPVEPDLAADLAGALGLPDAQPSGDQEASAEVLNPSLGTDTEVVLRINRADLALGTDRAGTQLLARLRGQGFLYQEAPELPSATRSPRSWLEYAAAEAEWLRDAAFATVLDPHGVLDTWTDRSVPEWYDNVSRRQAVLGDLDAAAADRETQLWRARQQRAAYAKKLEQPPIH